VFILIHGGGGADFNANGFGAVIATDRYVVAKNILSIRTIGHDQPLAPGILDNPPPAHPGFQIVFVLAGHHAGLAPGANLGIQVKGRSFGHAFHF
jgi:hypothetical protein